MASKLTMGERLRAAREMVIVDGERLSARELARVAGVSLSIPGKVERGDRQDHEVGQIEKIASVLGLSLDYLVKGEGPAPDAAQVTRAFVAARRLSSAAQARAS